MALALLSLTLVPAASGALAQDMGMGPLATTQHPTLGSIVTDANGLTVYTWAGDAAGAGTSACNGQCAAVNAMYMKNGFCGCVSRCSRMNRLA